MPLITGTVYLFGQILTFALPVGLLLCFATFFYRQGRRQRDAPPRPTTTPSTVAAGTTAATADAASSTAPPAPAAPSRPYSDL